MVDPSINHADKIGTSITSAEHKIKELQHHVAELQHRVAELEVKMKQEIDPTATIFPLVFSILSSGLGNSSGSPVSPYEIVNMRDAIHSMDVRVAILEDHDKHVCKCETSK